MTRTVAILLLAGGILLLVAALVLTLSAGALGLQSYLADWLFWSALPFGALPAVMLIDLGHANAGLVLEPALRRLLSLTPVAIALIVPILLRPADLFGWAGGHASATPFGRTWMTHGSFIARQIVILAIWAILAALFFRPPAPSGAERRRTVAALGLFIYLLTATLAAADWAVSVEPNWTSAEFGVLFIATQLTIAIGSAVLLTGLGWRIGMPEACAGFLIGATSLWLFTQFIQFLIIWSGDLPDEIVWFMHRANLGSRIAIWCTVVFDVVVPFVMLTFSNLRQRPAILPIASVLILVGQATGMLWLITPSLRQHFIITGMDILEFVGLGGVSVGLCLLFAPPVQPGLEAQPHAFR